MQRFVYFPVLAISLALAAGAGTAIGSPRPDDRATHGQGLVVLEQRTESIRPDDRATHGQGAIVLGQDNAAIRPDDRATHGQGAIQLEQVTRSGQVPVIASGGSEAASGGGFDLVDAGIGAAAAFGFGLIVVGSLVLARRRTRAPAYS